MQGLTIGGNIRVTEIRCGIINNEVVETDQDGQLSVTRFGQSLKINDPQLGIDSIPEFCPNRTVELQARKVSDFAVCNSCDYSAITGISE